MEPEEIDVCLLIGNSTRIPKIRYMLEYYFEDEDKINWEVNPDEAVATGAALMAGLLAQNDDNPGEPGERPEGPNLIVNDVIPLPIGLALANGRFSPIIKA